MRRGGRLELIVVLPDGSHLMVPAAWTDLQSGPSGRRSGRWCRLMICSPLGGSWSRCLSVSSWPRGMIAAEETISAVASGVGRDPAPAVALWELVGEEQRQTAMALLAALIAQTVAGEEEKQETRVGE